jgi:hypothetical protein
MLVAAAVLRTLRTTTSRSVSVVAITSTITSTSYNAITTIINSTITITI